MARELGKITEGSMSRIIRAAAGEQNYLYFKADKVMEPEISTKDVCICDTSAQITECNVIAAEVNGVDGVIVRHIQPIKREGKEYYLLYSGNGKELKSYPCEDVHIIGRVVGFFRSF